MRKSSWFVLAAVVVLVVGLILVKAMGKAPLTDEEQIRSLLSRGEVAIEQKDTKAAMSCISRNYEDPSGMKFDQLRIQAIQAFNQEGKYDVLMDSADVRVQGEAATAKMKVTVGLVNKGSLHQIFSSPVTIRLAKDEVKHWVVLPAREWKITSIEGAPFDLGE